MHRRVLEGLHATRSSSGDALDRVKVLQRE